MINREDMLELTRRMTLARTSFTRIAGCYVDKDGDIVGASFGKDATDEEFPYAIGAMYNGLPVEEEDLIVEEIPAHTYVVFPCVGKMPESFQKLYQQIYSEFFPSSEYQPCGGTDFEAYPSADVYSPDYHCEVWVAVEKK